MAQQEAKRRKVDTATEKHTFVVTAMDGREWRIELPASSAFQPRLRDLHRELVAQDLGWMFAQFSIDSTIIDRNDVLPLDASGTTCISAVKSRAKAFSWLAAMGVVKKSDGGNQEPDLASITVIDFSDDPDGSDGSDGDDEDVPEELLPVGQTAGDSLAGAIVGLLPLMPKLQRLWLPDRNISDSGAEKIGGALQELGRGGQLENLKSVHLGRNNISDLGAEKIAGAMPHLRIHTLWLDGNRIGDAGARHIAGAIPHTVLQELDLSGNNIGEEMNKKLRTVRTATERIGIVRGVYA